MIIMFYESHWDNHSSERLHRDLLGISETAVDNPNELRVNAAEIYQRIEVGLASPEHYYRTTETILNLIALVVTDEHWKDWFEPVAALVAQQPVAPDNLFGLGFREVVADFRPLVGVYGSLASARAITVADLLAAYTKLFRVLIFRHSLISQPTLLDQALKVSQRLGDHIETDKLYQTLALFFTHYGDADAAKQYARLAFSDSIHIEDAPGTLDAATTLAIIHRGARESKQADYYLEQALRQARTKKPDKLLATLFYEYAIQCYRKDRFELAISFYARALSIFDEYEALHQITMAKHAMAQTYIYMHAFDKVEALLPEVRQSWLRLGNQYDYVNTYFVEAEYEVERGNRSLGRRLLDETERLAYRTLENTPARAHLIELIEAYVAKHNL